MPPSPSPTTRALAATLTHHHATAAHAFFSKLDDLSSFTPLPTDIFVVSFMKSGTTLLQQLLYQLVVSARHVPSDPNGENFADISEVVPFLEARFATGVLHSVNEYHPRLWKSHADVQRLGAVLKAAGGKGKVIYCLREGRQVIRSYADFAVDWLAKDSIQGAELRAEVYRKVFLNCFLGLDDVDGGGLGNVDVLYDWFGHVNGWLQEGDRVLFVHFDDLISDLEGWVPRLARFVGVDVGTEQVEWVVAKCDRRKMAEDDRFRDGMVARLMGWRPDLGRRVRTEDEPGFKDVELPPECDREYSKRFEQVFGEGGWDAVVKKAEARNREADV